MEIKSQLRKSLLTMAILWSFLFSVLPLHGQVIVPGNIAGASSKYVIVGLKKKGNFTARRSSNAKRTRKQRSTTRRQVVKQSQTVAKKNRVRRDIDEISPEEYKRLEVQITRMPKDEASRVLAGAGEYYVTRDEVDKAVVYLEGAVELDGTNADAKLALSEVYTTLGDRALVRADEFAELAAKATSQDDPATARKNSALSNTETEKAESYYKAAVKNDPSNPSAYVGLGQFYDASDKDDLAKVNYEKALELDSGLTEVKGPLGIIYFQEGQTAKAQELIENSLAADPDNAESQFFLGLIYYKLAKNDEAIERLKKSISLDADNAESHYYLGATYSRIGQDDDAIAEFERSVGIDQRFVNAWFDLGVAYFNKGQHEKAIAAFEKAIEFNTNRTEELRKINDESYSNLAEAYRQDGKIDLSISKYRIAVARVKDDPELYTTYGFALAEKGLWQPAIEAFGNASKVAPDSPSVTTNFGWANYKAAMYYSTRSMTPQKDQHLRTAKSLLEKAVSQYSQAGDRSDQNLAAAELYLGTVMNELGETDKAISTLQQANRHSEEKWPAAINELGISYYSKKDFKEAIKQFRKAVKLQSEYADALVNLAKSEFHNGDEKEARRIQGQVRKIEPRLADQLDREFRRINFN